MNLMLNTCSNLLRSPMAVDRKHFEWTGKRMLN